jgi:hypothetical protein
MKPKRSQHLKVVIEKLKGSCECEEENQKVNGDGSDIIATRIAFCK